MTHSGTRVPEPAPHTVHCAGHGGENRGGVRSPLPSTGHNRSGGGTAPSTGAVRARCPPAALSDAAVSGAPRASRRRQDGGIPVTPSLCLLRGARQVGRCPPLLPSPWTAQGNPARSSSPAAALLTCPGGAGAAEPGTLGRLSVRAADGRRAAGGKGCSNPRGGEEEEEEETGEGSGGMWRGSGDAGNPRGLGCMVREELGRGGAEGLRASGGARPCQGSGVRGARL